MKSWVDITLPGRHAERYRLSDDGTSIGSSGQADIRLQGVPGLLGIHCSLRPTPEGCWVELIESAPEPFTHDGRPSRGMLVLWGHDVFFGSLRLTLDAEAPTAGRKGPSPVLWVAVAMVVLLGGAALLKPDAMVSAGRARVPSPPALFGPQPSCSEDAPGALARATAAEQLGRAKHERGVFERRDLVDGVQLMREAGVCYALGGNQGASDRALDVADDWIRDLEYPYRRAQLDWEIARRNGHAGRALTALDELAVLTTHAGPEAERFRGWLTQSRRQLLATLAKRRKK